MYITGRVKHNNKIRPTTRVRSENEDNGWLLMLLSSRITICARNGIFTSPNGAWIYTGIWIQK